MRIISGRFKGKTLNVPSGATVRPTSDRARGSLFNRLEHGSFKGHKSLFEGAQVLDLYAGSGALGLEALSRGATEATFVEKDRTVYSYLEENIQNCKLEKDRFVLMSADARQVSLSKTYDLLFLDPPYQQNFLLPTLENLERQKAWHSTSLIICERDKQESLILPESLQVLKEFSIGRALFSFLQPKS